MKSFVANARLQQFLLYTAVLTQMDAAVCDAVLETTGSQSILEELEQANLFIVSLDEARAWYRYHHLFREFLLARLTCRGGAEHRELNQRVARYYEAQAEWEVALGHHIAARDFDGACLMLTLIAPEYIDRGRTAVLQRSLADFRRSYSTTTPIFCSQTVWPGCVKVNWRLPSRVLKKHVFVLPRLKTTMALPCAYATGRRGAGSGQSCTGPGTSE